VELREYIRILRKGWLVVLAIAIGCAVLAAGVSAVVPRVYRAHTQLYVSAPTDGSGGLNDLIQSEAFARQAVSSYVSIANSTRVLDRVIEDLSLTVSADELGQSVSAEAPFNTVLINITVANPDPEMAAEIANSVSSNFANVITDELSKPTGDAPSIVEVDVTQVASPPTDPSSPLILLNTVLGLLLGLSLGLGFVIARSTLRSRKQPAPLDRDSFDDHSLPIAEPARNSG
jgi:succinoglycan biosynthesis transport protein ExoP